jgi:hypothetical protein
MRPGLDCLFFGRYPVSHGQQIPHIMSMNVISTFGKPIFFDERTPED